MSIAGSLSVLTNLMIQIGVVERRSNERTPAEGFELLFGSESSHRRGLVRDISHTGMFLATLERIQPGTQTMLTLVRKDGPFRSPRVRLLATAVRQDESGMGMTFLSRNSEARLWPQLMAIAARWTGPEDVLSRVSIAKALAFLTRFSRIKTIAKLMDEFMSSERRLRLAAVVLGAEERLEQWNGRTRKGLSALLLCHLLFLASVAEDELSQSFWSGLLASSLLDGSEPDDDLRFADLLSKLLPVDLSIFSAACERTLAAARSSSGGTFCSSDQIREIANTANLASIEQHLNHLYSLGLLGKTPKPLKGEVIDCANLTATPFGLELYARCCEFSAEHQPAPC